MAPHVSDNTADVWIGHARKYAKLVPGRISSALAETLTDAESAPESTADSIRAAIEAKLEGLRHSITRYAEPMWGAGQQGYGAALEANSVLLVWQLGPDEDHCADCPALADGSPYARGQIPTWPRAGDTACWDNCLCNIVADGDSWDAVFGAAA